ncbi:hypothetical protein MMS22_28380 [Escherichia coli]|nr:hypothetical protein [Escherichia coli]
MPLPEPPQEVRQ